MTTPRVSVLMPAWNAARFLDEAVESILSQDFLDFELVIVDDGSTDGSTEMFAAWAERDPRVVVLRNATNLGVSAASNVGLRAARGEYVARMDADDISMPGRLSAEVAVLDADASVAMVATNYEVMDVNGAVLRREDRVHPPEIVHFLLHFGNPIGGHSQVMFRRDLAMRGGGYDTSLTRAEDYELWTRLTMLGRIVILPIVGMRYRIHPGQMTGKELRTTDRWFEFCGMVLARYLGRELRRDEVVASTGAMRHRVEAVDWQTALSVLRESIDVFAKQHSRNRALMKALRRVLSMRLTSTAVTHLHARLMISSTAYFSQALAWDLVEAIRTATQLFKRAIRDRRRRAHRGKVGRPGPVSPRRR